MRHPLLYLAVLAMSFSSSVEGTDYYVSPAGDDSDPGTSPTEAWRTIDKANTEVFGAGDRLLFEGGSTFSGNQSGQSATHELFQLHARLLLPLLHEVAQAARLVEPDDRMDVVGHDHETAANRLVRGQFGRQQAHHDLTCRSVIQQAATSVTGKRDELGVQLLVVDTSSEHGPIVARTHEQYHPLVAMQHGHICRISVSSGNVLCGKVSVPPAGMIVLLRETLSQDRRCCSATRGAGQTSLIRTPAGSPLVAPRPRRFSEHADWDSSTYYGKSTGLPAK